MTAQAGFWEKRFVLLLLVAVTTVPFLAPAIPPLTDLPGHMAQYHVALNVAQSADLQRYYDFRWALAANLGLELLIVPAAKIFGLEFATKLITMAIPVALSAGFLGVARELHGRIPPTALFALPLTYHYAFQFGFMNFSLGAACCFLAFWLWLRMDRSGLERIRTLVFLPLACAIWLVHLYGWGMLGILVFAAQVIERKNQGVSWPLAVVRGGLDCAPLFLPFLLMMVWRSGDVASETAKWFLWSSKWDWLISILRERWQVWDVASAGLLLGLVVLGPLSRQFRIEKRALLASLLLLLLFLLLPGTLFSSGFADMRLAAFVVAVAVIGLEPTRRWSAALSRGVALLAILFLMARLGATSAAYAELDDSWRAQLVAVDNIPRGSRVLVLTDIRCREWADDRMDHISALAVTRRDVFTNGQWKIPGALLMQIEYQPNGPFRTDPSHLMRRPPCSNPQRRIAQAIQLLPGRYDYLWLVDIPSSLFPQDASLEILWQGDRGMLLRLRNAPPTTGGTGHTGASLVDEKFTRKH